MLDSFALNGLTLSSFKKGKQLLNLHNKIVFQGPSSDTLILRFKDEQFVMHASNSQSHILLYGKAAFQISLSEIISKNLNKIGIWTTFIKKINMYEQLVYALDTLPFFIKINFSAQNIFENQQEFMTPVMDPIIEPTIESCSNNGFIRGEDKVVSDNYIIGTGTLDRNSLEKLYEISKRVSDFLFGFFSAYSLRLMNCSLNFGAVYDLDDCVSFVLANDWSFDQFVVMDEKTEKIYDSTLMVNEDEIKEYFDFLETRMSF